ncbi:probable G-protein coupled receptor No9 [Gigantopelta aegis]|uniref:probable G-protein coupled receptor No9 n=1 Tax=Gigantopelta aegis TaxID=1735272 RepID=UPI001B889E1D|nr:probable G-protein coupled receptor No9 [Gigantopelta aegis]
MNTTEDLDSVLFWGLHDQGVTLEYLMVNIVLFIIGVFVVFLNAVVFYAMTRENPSDGDVSNYIIANLSVTDMITGMFVVYTVVYNLVNFQSKVECYIRLGFVHFFSQSSVFHLVLLTADRYVKIIFPYKHIIIFKRRPVIYASAIIWVLSFLYGALPIMGWHKALIPGGVPCSYLGTLSDGFLHLTMATYFSPSFMLNVMYAHIFMVARKHQRAIRNLEVGPDSLGFDKKSWKLTKTVVIISGAYILCWTPMGIVIMLHLYGFLRGMTSEESSSYVVYGSISAYCNALVNPIIYAFKLPVVRKYYKRLFCSCVCRHVRHETPLGTNGSTQQTSSHSH